MPLNLPRVQSAVVDATGRSTREWYDFFRSISEIEGLDAGLKKQINDIILRIEKIEKNGGLTFKLEARDSIAMEGLPSNGYVMFTLANDTNQPGSTFIYGTNALGEKGWHMLADGFEVVAESLTKTVDPETNITTYDLAEVTDAGGGQLLKFARDSKGRVTGTSAPTTDDLQEGTNNLYYTDERARDAAPVQSVNGKNGDVILSAGDVGAEPFLVASNAKAFLRGDRQWTNILNESFVVGGDNAAFFFQDRSGTEGQNWAWYAGADAVKLWRWGIGDIYRLSRNEFLREADNATSLGGASNRWSVIYAATGAINTSDARDKTGIRSFNDGEVNAAMQLSKEVRIYRWNDSVTQKGNEAREHIGLTVQRAIEIMQSNDLDPFNYGFICYDEWKAQDEVLDEKTGNVMQPGREAGDRYGFRYDQLNLFIARGLAARLDALESKLTALSDLPDSSELVGV